ncbi:Clathrin light chain [Cladobotryum mycophilum]|uniref:Clathrin light chain n=1 Tax=Cladobotryum mycophilum TaxID=491253 RepID=A0ABR0SUP6_9HYPO
MADRFPSIEDFDSGAQADIIQDPTDDASAQDFLAREKALLGDDANLFATSDDANAFAEPGGDLLGESDNAAATFDSQFPDLADPSAGTAGIPGTTSITGPSVSYNSGFQAFAADEEEPEVIKEWRERRDAQLAKRTEQFVAQREETIKEAQQNIDDFYENYNSKKEKGIAQTRKEAEEFLASREDTVSGGTSWDRIAKLVDVSGKGVKGGAAGSGKERFRETLMSLRKDEKAPGATGY